jgi:putative IMPACT (imprinted ancient) family translation regulator
LGVAQAFGILLDVEYSERGASISVRVGDSAIAAMEEAIQNAAKGQAKIKQIA